MTKNLALIIFVAFLIEHQFTLEQKQIQGSGKQLEEKYDKNKVVEKTKHYVAKWNDNLESAQNWLNRHFNFIGPLYDTFWTQTKIAKSLNSFFQRHIPELYGLVQKSSNKQAIKFKLNEKIIHINYFSRRILVLALTSVQYCLLRRRILRPLFFWSLLFCRENFNLKNYQL